jgi:hypothetical protein
MRQVVEDCELKLVAVAIIVEIAEGKNHGIQFVSTTEGMTMRALVICLTVLFAGLMFANTSQAQDYYSAGIGSGLPYYGYGYSGSLYGLGRVPVPPYFSLHPPVYYSHEIQRRPVGDSPYAYSPQRSVAAPTRQCSKNPFVTDVIIEEDSKQISEPTESVAQVMQNPFYNAGPETLATSKMIYNPYYAKSEAVVAQVD